MEAIYSSKPSADFQWTARLYFPEDRTLHDDRRENLKSCKFFVVGLCNGALDFSDYIVSNDRMFSELERLGNEAVIDDF
jgi:hypothetical protein